MSLTLELDGVREERDTARSELNKAQEQLEEKEQAIANLTTENQKLEEWLGEAAKNEKFLTEELERFKYGVSLADDEPGETPGEVEEEPPAVHLLPEKPEILEEQTPAVETEAETVNSQESAISDQSSVPSDEPTETSQPKPSTLTTATVNPETKLYDPKELAKWINDNYPGEDIKDYNVRDWFTDGKGSDRKRKEKQEKYKFTFSHKNKRGTLLFTVP